MSIEQLEARFGIPGAAQVSTGMNGLPKLTLRHGSGASAEVYLHGAHVTSWKDASGKELFFLSRQSWFEAERPIRGGIPVIFPQFGGRGPLPAHGIARIHAWQLVKTETLPGGDVRAVLRLEPNEAIRALWPHPFRLELRVRLGAALTLELTAANTGAEAFDFTTAFHTYFAVGDIRRVGVRGLKGVTFVDSLRDNAREVEPRERITFDRETDRVYVNAPDRMYIDEESAGGFVIQKRGMADAVVWNPWIEKSKRMPDFGDEEYVGMVCVETGNVDKPVRLAAGESWTGGTEFTAT